MKSSEFANKIRTKYPGAYDALSDEDLTQKVVAKYPQYASQIDDSESTEGPGTLQSAALGVMSGVPFAETAAAKVKSMVGDQTYEEAHKGIEDLKDQAWDKHPVAYGGGKGLGIVGTGAVAPGGLAADVAAGVGYGLDTSEKPENMVKDATIGGATGGVLGTATRAVTGAVAKYAPKIGKGILASLGKPTRENIDELLARPDAINGALKDPEISTRLQKALQMVEEQRAKMSGEARGLLSNEVPAVTAPGIRKASAPTVVRGGGSVGDDVALGTAKAPETFNPGDKASPAVPSAAKSPETVNFPKPNASSDYDAFTGAKIGDTPPNLGLTGGPTTVTHGELNLAPAVPEVPDPNDLGLKGGPVTVTHGEAAITPSTPQIPDPNDLGLKKGDITVTHGGDVDAALTGQQTPDTLRPIIEDIKSRFMLNGVAKSPEAESAIRALDSQYERIAQMAQANGGSISQADLRTLVSELQKNAQKSFVDGASVSASKEALGQLSGAFNAVLKSPEAPNGAAYAEAMKPVADRASVIADTTKAFNLHTKAEGFAPKDATAPKVGQVLKEGKVDTQDILSRLKDMTGEDIIQLAKDSRTREAFDAPGAGEGLKAVLATLGFGVGKFTGIPYGGILGAAGGRFIGGSLDGGTIVRNVINTYLNIDKAMVSNGTKAAIQKYGPILANAAKQGGNHLASTHFVLATSHPDYQAAIEELQKEQPDEENAGIVNEE